jgi:hypothetical protein
MNGCPPAGQQSALRIESEVAQQIDFFPLQHRFSIRDLHFEAMLTLEPTGVVCQRVRIATSDGEIIVLGIVGIKANSCTPSEVFVVAGLFSTNTK